MTDIMRRATWVQNVLGSAIFKISTIAFRLDSELLTDKNLSLTRQGFTALAYLCLSWHDRSPWQNAKPIFDKWVEAIASTDLGTTLRGFDSLKIDLISESSIQTEDLDDTFLPIKGILRHYIRTSDAETLRHLLSYLSFLSKLKLDRQDIVDDAIQTFVEVDERLNKLNLTGSVLERMKPIITGWFHDFKLPNVLPVKHGPGTTAEGIVDKEQKYLALCGDRLYDLALMKLDHPYMSCDYTVAGKYCNWDRTSRLFTVYKSWKSVRTICAEPVPLQYHQQGIAAAVNRHLRKKVSEHIDFSDQSRNRDLARLGSYDGEYATIDLSMASDTLSWKVVSFLFRDTPLYWLLLTTRSYRVLLPDGTRVRMAKYAPMGSALNFPIQSITYAALIEAVIQGTTVESNWEREMLNRYLVFGDDLIVYHSIADEVMSSLESIGFTVNRDKSYFDLESRFRESCGGWYMEGHDVTPIYYRLPAFSSFTNDLKVKLNGAINVAFFKGYLYYRSYLIDLWKENVGHSLAFTNNPIDSSRAFTVSRLSNDKRYNRNLQRLELLETTARVHDTNDKKMEADHIRLYDRLLNDAVAVEFGHEPLPFWEEDIDFDILSSRRTTRIRYRRGWTPASELG